MAAKGVRIETVFIHSSTDEYLRGSEMHSKFHDPHIRVYRIYAHTERERETYIYVDIM